MKMLTQFLSRVVLVLVLLGAGMRMERARQGLDKDATDAENAMQAEDITADTRRTGGGTDVR